jgi:hypothetical protein
MCKMVETELKTVNARNMAGNNNFINLKVFIIK